MKFQPLLLSLLLLFAHVAHGQSGRLFSVDHELTSSMINHVYQDHYGMIWMATEDGLNRYDGAKFISYKKDKQDSSSLLHNYVKLLFEDHNKKLYVGFFNGLQTYNHATETFNEIPLYLENGKKFPSHVTSILERKNGDILIGSSGHGIFVLNKDSTTLTASQHSELVASYLIKFLHEDRKQNLWVGTQDKGLYRIGKDGAVKSFFNAKDSDGLHSLCEDNVGTLYAGSITKGLFIFDQKNEKFVSVNSTNKIPLAINTLYSNKIGEILIGTEGNGVKIYDPIKKKISDGNFTIDTFDFSKSKIHTILEDNTGNLWLGVYQKGIVLLPTKTNNFEYYGHKSIKNDVIGSNNITAIYKDKNDQYWIGTDGDGIFSLCNTRNEQKHFKPNVSPNGVPSTILNIYEDSNHTLWLGSYDRGLCKFNRQTGECIYLNSLLTQDKNEILRVFSIMEDTNNNLWVATMGSGLFVLNQKTNKVVQYKALTGKDYRPEINVLHNDWINTILITKKNKLFIGTVDGLSCLDLTSLSFTNTFNKNRMLPSTIIRCLYEDAKGTIWVGTTDGLISLAPDFNINTDELTNLTTDDGLPSNEICAVREDLAGNLWISTKYGISKFNKQTKSFVNYYAGDGLQGNEFTQAAHADLNGQLAFGGLNGITMFNPSQITNEVKKFNVHITGFYLHNQPIKQGMKSGSYNIITSSVMDADVFHLAQDDNSFTIEFSAMEFSNPERITFMYTLDGNDWIVLRPGTNNVTFNNLAPGQYTFTVKAKDYNTYSDIKTISVIVHPVWYFSTWAKFIYGLLIVIIGYIIFRQVQLRQQSQRKILEHIHTKKINEAKLQFFINIAHEIRTPMSLIISPLKKIMGHDKDRDRQRSYSMMNRNIERILHLINQLMDIQKIDQGQITLRFQETEMVEFIHDLCYVFDDQTQEKQIELIYNHEMKTLNAWIDPNNFDKIILNILSNALKFTPAKGKITVTLSTITTTDNQNNFEVIVADTGTGIQEHELEKVFDCFYQVRESQHPSTPGTGIGLHLTRSIVELHHGNIWAENNPDGCGCRFILRVPLGKAHLKPEELITQSITYPKTEYKHTITAQPELPEAKIKSRSKHKVLVVDDDQGIREYLCNEMAHDYHMSSCCNGKEALTSILKDNPDLIISDIKMPEMDGITLCQKIKQHVHINHIPVILLTAKTEEEDNLTALGIGADAYIIKPFNIDILNKTVQNIIKNREMLKNNFAGNQTQKDKIADLSVVSADEKLLNRIMDTINNNIDNTELNVEMLSNEIGISRVHLHRKLKELTNQSPRDLIRNIRLQQAAKLLSEKHLNISEVGFAVGFTNVAHFSNAFKEFYGVPPTNYMEKNHPRKQPTTITSK